MKIADRVRLIKQQLLLCGGVASLDRDVVGCDEFTFIEECKRAGLRVRVDRFRLEIMRSTPCHPI